MSDKTILEKIISAILQVVVPDKVILFGSQARGEARPDSDYDILVVLASNENELNIGKKIYRNLVNFDIPVGVDIIVKSPEGVERSKNLFVSVVKDALKEGIVVYG